MQATAMKTHHTCPCCKETKPVEEFHSKHRFGRCKVCKNAKARESYASRREEVLQRMKTLRAIRAQAETDHADKCLFPDENHAAMKVYKRHGMRMPVRRWKLIVADLIKALPE